MSFAYKQLIIMKNKLGKAHSMIMMPILCLVVAIYVTGLSACNAEGSKFVREKEKVDIAENSDNPEDLYACLNLNDAMQVMHDLLFASDVLSEVQLKLDSDTINPEERHELMLTRYNVREEIKRKITELKQCIKKKRIDEDYIEYETELKRHRFIFEGMTEQQRVEFLLTAIESLRIANEKIASDSIMPDEYIHANETLVFICRSLPILLEYIPDYPGSDDSDRAYALPEL